MTTEQEERLRRLPAALGLLRRVQEFNYLRTADGRIVQLQARDSLMKRDALSAYEFWCVDIHSGLPRIPWLWLTRSRVSKTFGISWGS